MKDGLKLYFDHLCTKTGMIIERGVAAVLGDSASLSDWGSSYTDHGYIYHKNSIDPADFVLSGGTMMYDYNVPYDLPYPRDPTLSDTETDSSSSVVWNPLFVTTDDTSDISLVLAVTATETPAPNQYIIRIYEYTQVPYDMQERSTWSYTQIYLFGGMQNYDTTYSQLKLYRCTIENQDFTLFALNVKASGETDAGITRMVLIPDSFFDGLIPEGDYAGQESQSNSDIAYTPTAPYRGSVSPRDLTGKRNPYGFNTGNGLTLAIISEATYAAILQGIYAGTAESVLNKIAQGFSQLVGGNTHRPADEVSAITGAILACHKIPQITGYAHGTTALKTIAGYHVLGGNGDSAVSMTLNITQNVIFEYTTSTYYISRRLNNFLDFEPYTSMQLHLPFMPVITLQPSSIYGNGIKIHYTIDIFTGVLSADVMIIDPGSQGERSREYILTTVQTNIKTDIPIMGNAAQAGIFGGLTSAIVGAMGGKDDTAVIAAGVSAADDLSKISTGSAVGKMSIDGIGAYMSSRTPFILITRPIPSVPTNKYLSLMGSPSHQDGAVGDFKGFSVFESVDLSSIAATESEKRELESMLKGGVFV